MSTSAEIGRWPADLSRRCIHSGEAPFFTPRDRPAEEGRAAVRILDPDRHRAGEAALDLRHRERLQRADARRREVAGNAAHAHAVLAVGRDRHVEHRIVEPGIVGVGGADRRILGQLDDPVMIVAQLELARRAHHAARFDAADRRDLQRHVAARDIGAGRAEHAEHARRGHWARRTRPGSARRSPASTVSTWSLSACGCLSAVSTLRDREAAPAPRPGSTALRPQARSPSACRRSLRPKRPSRDAP